MDLPSVGFHYGVSFETYRAWDAVNIHRLMPMDDSPAHCLHEMQNPREASPEMEVGSATHVAVFEPARLEKEFYFGQEEYNATTTEGKVIKARELEEAAGRIYIRKKKGEAVDCDSVTGMARSLREWRKTRRWLDMPGQCEVSALWRDPVTQLMCKGRFDKFIPTEVSPYKVPIVVEFKSCGKGKAKTQRFGKEIASRFYAAQAEWYRWGIETLTGLKPLHVFIIAENVPPYVPNWGTLDDADMQTGTIQFRAWLDQYAECGRSSKWPGYPEEIDGKAPVFRMPHWASWI